MSYCYQKCRIRNIFGNGWGADPLPKLYLTPDPLWRGIYHLRDVGSFSKSEISQMCHKALTSCYSIEIIRHGGFNET